MDRVEKRKTTTILIVDDSELNRVMLAAMLGENYEILEASDGVEALSVIQKYETSIDLVLLDIVMPGMDGFEVLKVMNQKHWIDTIPVIMISAENDTSYMEKAYELGATDYIKRPYESYIIHRRITNTLMLYEKQKRLLNMVEEQIYEKEKNNSMMINILGHIVEFRNGESGPHVHHVQTMTRLLLQCLMKKTNSYNLTDEDVETLRLLDLQLYGNLVFIVSDVLSYISTIESIDLVYSKYENTSENLPDPDVPALESAYLAVIARSILFDIGFARYGHLVEKFNNGEIDFSLSPDEDINLGNIFGMISYMYFLRGVMGIYERDLSLPVFGL